MGNLQRHTKAKHKSEAVEQERDNNNNTGAGCLEMYYWELQETGSLIAEEESRDGKSDSESIVDTGN